MRINFISSLGTGEFRILHSKSDNIEIMIGIKTDDIINEVFESLLRRLEGITRNKNGRK